MVERDGGRARLRRGLIVAIVCLYVLSVPWYRAPDAPLRLWLGLPDWVFTALACYVAAAVLNAWAWWITDVDDEYEAEPRDHAQSDRAPGTMP